MRRLTDDKWKDIFRNLGDEEVEVLWLDNGTGKGNNEWCLCYGVDMFERGFNTETEAAERLKYLENKLLN